MAGDVDRALHVDRVGNEHVRLLPRADHVAPGPIVIELAARVQMDALRGVRGEHAARAGRSA
jgi:hypothetical protein